MTIEVDPVQLVLFAQVSLGFVGLTGGAVDFFSAGAWKGGGFVVGVNEPCEKGGVW